MKKKLFSLLLIAVLSVFLISCKAKTAVLSFVTNQSSLTLSSVSVEIGTEIDLTKKEYQLTVDGYTFKGWYLDEALTSYARSVTLDKDITIYAKWAKLYTITFDTNGGSAIASETVEAGNTVERPANPSKNDHVFNGWYTDSELTHEFSFLTEIDRDITLYAGWLQALTVTFESNGGSRVESIPVLSGEKIELPDNPTKTGYEFGGWFRDSALTQAFSESQSITADITLYAKWDAHSYSVIFNGNGATSGTVNAEQFEYDEEKALSDNLYLKTGYIFTGWNTHSDGSGTSYEDKMTIKNLLLEDGARLTLYAQWKPIEYVIKFNGGSATGEMQDVNARYDENVVLPISSLTYEGHQLSGWALSLNGDVIAQDGGTVNNLTTTDGAVITLYAIFDETSYTVVFNKNASSATGEMADLHLTYSQLDDLDECKFVNLGYNFLGWSKTPDGAVEIEDGAIISKLSSTDGATVTLYAVWELNKVIVTLNSGIAYGSDTVLPEADYFTQVALPVNPYSLTGYHFLGWSTTQGGAVVYLDQATLSNLLESVTLYAVWQINTYTVEFNANGGSGSVESESYQYNEEKALNINSFTRVGYIFKEWNTNQDGSGIKYADQASVKNLTENNDQIVVLYAQWTPITYEVKFDANGAEGSLVNESFTYDVEKALSKNTFTYEYYRFVSWNTKADGTGFNYEDEKVVKNLSDTQDAVVTLYAQWTLSDYTISYDANGGSGEMLTDRKDLNTPTVHIPSCKFTKAGYTFKEWNTKADGTGTTYQANQSYNEHLTSTVGENVKLYAQWTANSYTLKFDANNGSGSMSDMSFTYDEAQNLTLNAFTRKGYEFASWNTKADGTGTAYSNQEEVMNLTTSGIITLYAQWNLIEYTITYNLNGGENDSNNPDTYTITSENIAFANPTRLGYTFLGWYSNDGLTGEQVSGIVSGSIGSVVLYASWQVIPYSISYTLNGGENNANNPKQYTVASDDISFLSATKTGYTFVGWYTDSEFSEETKVEGIAKGSRTGNLSLYAKFTANTYTVHFNANGGSGNIADQVFTYDQAQSLTKSTLIRLGYTFLGWSDDSSASEAIYTDEEQVSNLTSIANGEVTLYAVWSINTYNITYVLNGGSNSSSNVLTYTVLDAVVLLDATKVGYTFVNWTIGGNPTTGFNAGETGDKEFTANFTVNHYTVTFHANNGTSDSESQEFSYDGEGQYLKSISLLGYTKTGFTFQGWNTAQDGSGTSYADEALMFRVLAEDGANIDLYAQWAVNSYTITFNHNNPSESQVVKGETKSITATYTQEVTLTNGFSIDGYEFAGWIDASNNEYANNEVVTGLVSESSGSIELKAKWNKITYTVTVQFDNGDADSSFTYDIETEGFLISTKVADPTKTGYTFAGWKKNSENITSIEAHAHEDITIVASWNIVTYTISYNLAGGSVLTANPTTYNVESAAITLVNPTRTGYTFAGWTGTGLDSATATVTIAHGSTGDRSYVATWTANTYTVHFNANGGTGSIADQVFTYDQAQNLTLNVFTRSGYTFLGWSLDYEATVATFADQEEVSNLSSIANDEITLYAIWSLNTYSISYELAGGSVASANPATYNVESTAITLTNPTRTGYTFAGWTGTGLDSATISVTIAQGSTGDRSYVATWTANTYTVHFNANGGTGSIADQVFTYDQAQNLTLNIFERTGYTFAGWNTEADGSGNAYSDEQEVSNLTSIANGEVTLYAQWSTNSYLVTLNSNGADANSMSKSSIGYNVEDDDITILTYLGSNPTKVGYTFGGWYKESNFSGEEVTVIETSEAASYTLYAKWNLVTYTVTVVFDNGDSNSSFEYNIETPTFTVASIIDNPTKTGYTFAGWMKGESAITEVALGSHENFTIEATWNIVTYNISYNLAGGSVANANPTTYNVESASITLTNPTRTNYVFAGWTGTGLDSATMSVTIVQGSTGDRSYIATWTPEVFNISYNLAGGSVASANPATYNVESADITLVNPTRTGYTFAGWTGTGLDSATMSVTIAEGSSGERAYTATWNIVTYNISYNLAGGSVASANPATYNVESAAITLVNPTRTGYTFAGWTGTGLDSATASVTIAQGSTGDRTFTATWNVINYSVSYAGIDGADNSANASKTSYTIEASLQISNPTKAGYTFAGWIPSNTDTSEVLGEAEIDLTIAVGEYLVNVTLTATWNIVTYNISYNLVGGSVASANPATYNVESAAITLVNPTRTGYTFAGWTGTGLDSATASVTIAQGSTGDRSYTATWTANTYTVHFNANGGSGNIADQVFTYDQAQALRENTQIARTGYTFLGWSLDYEATVASYADQEEVSNLTSIANGEVTLYAIWEANTYTVHFNANGGTGSIANESFTYDVAKALTKSTLIRLGYTFLGWSEDSSATIASYADEEEVSNLSSSVNGEVTLYAVWSINIYNITYAGVDGADNSANTTTYTILDEVVFASPSKNGYTFTSWIDSESDPIDRITAGSTGDVTITATWSLISYTLTYVVNGGEFTGVVTNPATYNVESLDFGTQANQFPVVTRAGYDFAGWYFEDDFSGSVVSVFDCSENYHNSTLYAKWAPHTYVINLSYANEGKPVAYNEAGTQIVQNDTKKYSYSPLSSDSITVKYETLDSFEPFSPYLYGYEFIGWGVKKSGAFDVVYLNGQILPWIPESLENGNDPVTLVAVYRPYTYEVTYDLGFIYNGNADLTYEFTFGESNILLTLPAEVSKPGYTFDYWSYSGVKLGGAGYALPLDLLLGSEGASVKLDAVWYKTGKFTVNYSTYDSDNYAEQAAQILYTISATKIECAPADAQSTIGAAIGAGNCYHYSSGVYTHITGANMGEYNFETEFTNGRLYTAEFTAVDVLTEQYDSNKVYGVSDSTKAIVTVTNTVGLYLINPGSQWDATSIGAALYASGGVYYVREELGTTYTRRIYTGDNDALLADIDAYKVYTPTITKLAADAAYDGSTYYECVFDSTVEFRVSDSINKVISKELYNNDGSHLDKDAFTSVGKYIEGWYTRLDFDTTLGERYDADEATSSFAANSNITLYAKWADIYATFTYNLNGATGDAPAQHVDVTHFTANNGEGIVREHYSLIGWNREADGSGIMYGLGFEVENLAGYNPGDSVVLYAQWVPETYTVTFVKGNESATGSMETQEFSYNVGQTLSANLFQYQGYNFVSWSGSDSKTYYEGVEYVINADVTLTAQWAQEVKTITYNANFTTDQTMTQTSFTSQGTIKINLFTRTGYTFAGWNTQTDGLGTPYVPGDTVSATTTLYAQWTLNKFYVAFNANGGTGSIANLECTYGTPKALTENTITRAGYRFTGWNTKADGSGTSYDDEASVSNLTDINGGIVTLYAQWAVNTYKVRFNPNGGTGSSYFEYYQNSDVLTYGVEAVLLKNTFTRSGYAFMGWSTVQNATTADLVDGQTIATQLVPETDGEIIELYAVWSQSSYTVTIKSSTNDSTLTTINVLKDSGIVVGTSQTLLEYINDNLNVIANYDSTNGIYIDKSNSNYAYVGIYTTSNYLDSDKLTNSYVARNNITFYAYFAVAAIFDLSEIDQDNIVVPLGIGGSSYNAFAHFPEIDSPDGLIYVWDVVDDSLKSISETTIIKLYSIEFDGVHSTANVTIDKTENTFQRLIVTLPNSHEITLMLTYTGSIGVNGVINSSSQIYTAMDTSSDFKYVDASSELVVSQSAHGQAFIQGISGFYQFHVYRTLSEFSLSSGYGAYDALVLNGTRYINTVKTTYKVGTSGIWKLRFSISDNGLAQLSAHDVSKHYELYPQGSDTPYTTQIGSYTDAGEEYVTYNFYKDSSKTILLAYIIVNYDESDKSYDAIQFTNAAEGMIFDIKVRPTFTLQKASNTISLNNVEVNNGVNVETSSELKRAYADISVENINIHSKIIAELEANQYHDFYDSSLPHTPINFSEVYAVGISQGTYEYSYNGIPVTTTGNVYVRAYTKNDFEHNVEAKNLTINGNYFTIDASRVPVVDLDDDGTPAFSSVEPNYTNANYDRTKFANKYIKNVKVAIFAQYTQYRPNKDNEYYGMNDVKVSYENMHIISNTITPYVDYGEDDETINNQVDTACYNSGGYIGIRTVQGTEETHNVIVDYSVIGLFASGYNTTINAYDTYVYYSWANALYTHGSGNVKLRNCEFRYSGGALSHVEELDNEKGTTEESSVFGSEIKVSVQHDLGFDVDDRSRNINWIAGNEIWMVLYGMNVLKSLMIVPMDQTVQDATGGTGGANGRYGILKTYDQLEKGKQGDTAYTINYQNSTELFNWAVLYMDKTPDGEGGKSGTYVGQLHSAFNGVTLDRANYTTDATNAGLFPVISTYGNGLGYEESSLGHLSTFPFYIAPVSSHSADYDHLNNPNYATNGLPYVIDSAWVEKPGETWDQNNAWAEGLTGDYAIKHHDGTPTPYGWAEIGVFADGFNGIGYVIAYFPYGER